MSITLEVKKVGDERYLSAILDILNRHYRIKASFDRPRLSRTYTVRLEGESQDAFENDFRAFASTVGWEVQRS